MVFQRINLTSNDKTGLETEVRFHVAGASVDACELLAFSVTDSCDEEDRKKLTATVKRILSVLKREGRIVFYLGADALGQESTEAEFLKNKYLDYLSSYGEDRFTVYVKI